MELRAEDLRCNNILLVDDGKGEPYQITIKGINTINGGHVYDEDDAIHGLDSLKPIPLTEEWILKFGFEKRFDVYNIEDFEIANLTDGLNEKSFSLLFDDKLIFQEFIYVHQLQNLFYALTNKELQVL